MRLREDVACRDLPPTNRYWHHILYHSINRIQSIELQKIQEETSPRNLISESAHQHHHCPAHLLTPSNHFLSHLTNIQPAHIAKSQIVETTAPATPTITPPIALPDTAAPFGPNSTGLVEEPGVELVVRVVVRVVEVGVSVGAPVIEILGSV